MESDGKMWMRRCHLMAAEHVTDGHPDKICDQLADTILDAALVEDPNSRVAMEVCGGHGKIFVTGELTSRAKLDIESLAHQTCSDIGYADNVDIILHIDKQSPDIAEGVDQGGAGDQGVMVGYAITDTEELMPLSWIIARNLCIRLKEVRLKGILPYLHPDGKSQVTIRDREVVHVTIACHHSEDVVLEQLYTDVYKYVVLPVVPCISFDNTVINGKGKFIQGGFNADAGLTGRKIVVDNYGPNIEVGGGCYSGKDPTKVDRSAAYMCRLVAKSIVTSGMATEALVKVAYAIGTKEPTLISVQTNGLPDKDNIIRKAVLKKFDFHPRAIIERLGLQQLDGWNYRLTAAFGHYGRPVFPWEKPVEL